MHDERRDDEDPRATAATPAEAVAAEDLPPVQHCPFCGESIGSFWGRRGDDGSHWCESCQAFFRVELA